MPIPKPQPNQTQAEFIAVCVPAIIDEYGEEQAVAVCMAAWEAVDNAENQTEGS
jgi:hypothetical protein